MIAHCVRVGQYHADQGCLPFGNFESPSDRFGNLEGSVRSAGGRSLVGGVADLIEAGLNEAAGSVWRYGDWGFGLGLG